DDRKAAIGGCLWEVARSSEYRTLHDQGSGNRVWSTSFSPDSRLLASASSDGVRLWDLATAKEIAWLSRIGDSLSVDFHPDDGSLITCGPAGVYRWPLRPDPEGAVGSLRLGPPQPVG